MKDTFRADPHEDLGSGVGQPNGERDRVIAGVEHEHRCHVAVNSGKTGELVDLVDGDGHGVLVWCDPSGIHWCGPRIGCPTELGDPLIRPAGNDGLTIGMFRRRIVEAPLRTGFGVASIPCRRVDREHGGPVLRAGLDKQPPEPVSVDHAASEGFVEAAVRAAQHRLKTQRWH